ncbi:lytic murein transglycosylase [Ruegeria sp. 2205SS24-7]|uniref:lytic murein transglycosylase n=1 Tax=Ruegeria discodermiae TaxID=3064389 RepID=UPI0027404B35|nr:lytic murein transglycosylase [Ruegeria sp. 2205SS24-7]MDP5218304.1 lytic murein transglycosylase [Ruegeria sp. 2205SS24-7]
MINWKSGAVGTIMAAFGSTHASAEAPHDPDKQASFQLASVTTSLRPVARPAPEIGREVVQVAASNDPFALWLSGFRGRALEQGISAGTLDVAFANVTIDPDVVRLDRNQSEFSKTIWQYLDSAVSTSRVKNGRAALAKHATALSQIEAHYGVEKEVVTAIWGLESSFGAFRGSNNTIRSLATLAHDTRRSAFFEAELVAALQILEAGDVSARGMKGSWAGAMGHTQFMPSSYHRYAVDFTGDGKRDIWSDDPRDALASTAAYLAGFGWTEGQPWGVEVRLPKGFDYAQARRDLTRFPSDWAAAGVVDVSGKPVPDHGEASILLPAGSQGAAFMVFDNFAVLEKYNTADAYVIGVGYLADRIAGGPVIAADWPRGDRALTFSERKELQRRLTGAGFDTQKIDGRVGPLTINAVRSYQTANGLVPDGYASPRLLERLR